MYPHDQTRLSAPGPIYRLDDDSLINIFYHYEFICSESYGDVLFFPDWDSARWWYKPAQVCQQWRHLILASPIRLRLHLLCTYGTPVANMLAHSPPLPIIINYLDYNREASAEDEEAIMLALRHRVRVRRIGLRMPATNLLKYINTLDGQFPVLERLFISASARHNISLLLPATFQAPNLCMLSLIYATLPVGSPLFATTLGLRLLALEEIPLSAYFHPSYLVARLSSMPQLEYLSIGFTSSISTRDVERQPLHTPVGTHITLPNLRVLLFRGVSAYLGGLLARISTPLLEILQIRLFNQLSFNVPHFPQFIDRTESFRFSFARLFIYREIIGLSANGRKGERVNTIRVTIRCRHGNGQIAAVVQIVNALVPALSAVERLNLRFDGPDLSSGQHNEINRMQWRDLLRPFTGVKALFVSDGLVTKLAHFLPAEDGEPPLELLPELEELSYPDDGDPSNALISFTNARQTAGRPITLTHTPFSLLSPL